jgi:Type IV secretion system pilin
MKRPIPILNARTARYAACRRVCGTVLARTGRAVGHAVVLATSTVTVLAFTSGAALAASTTPVDSIDTVVSNLRLWLMGILATVATLYLTVGGLRYITANGDPGEIEKAKQSFKSAALGYALALLAPLLVTIVGGWVTK